MDNELSKVVMHVETYFKNYLPEYSVLEVRRKSFHPDDNYLFMVSAKKSDDDTFAVWTNWNEQTQCLNHGHYGLKSISACNELLSAYQNGKDYFTVYKYSQNAKFQLFDTDNEEDARKFCEEHQWEMTDENNFVWNLDYCEISMLLSSDGKEIDQ